MANIRFRIKLEVLFAVVDVCVGDKDFREKFIKRNNLEASQRTAACYYVPTKDGMRICIIMNDIDIAGFAHEAVHAATFIQGHMHVMSHWDNDELTAYIVEHLMQKFLLKTKREPYGN